MKNNNYYIGVETGGTKIQVVLGDADLNIIGHCRETVEKSQGAAGVLKCIERGIYSVSKQYQPSAIGVGFGAPIDHETGKVSMSYHVEGWENFEFLKWIRQITDLPVSIDNDANTAALGEAVKGAGENYSKLFYVTLGSGVGGGLVVDGQIYHGKKPGEAEIGLISYDKSGANIESRCSGWAVDKKIRKYITENPQSKLAALVGAEESAETRFLLAAIQQGDAGAQQILSETADDLAFALSHVVHLMNPEIIVLGGGLSLIGEPLRAAVQKQMPKFIDISYRPDPPVKIAVLGENVVCVGALELARRKVC